MAFFSSNGGFEDRYKPTRSPRISDPPLFNSASYLREPFYSQAGHRASLQTPASSINDSRNLHRRFTTSHYSSIAQPRRSAFDLPSGDIFAVSIPHGYAAIPFPEAWSLDDSRPQTGFYRE